MSVWGEIKKALNSTLGTANFKPLDKIIEDAGFKPQLNVKLNERAIVTVTDGTTTYTQEGNGELTFFLNSYAKWTVTAKNSSGVSLTVSRFISATGLYGVEIDLSKNTAYWDDEYKKFINIEVLGGKYWYNFDKPLKDVVVGLVYPDGIKGYGVYITFTFSNGTTRKICVGTSTLNYYRAEVKASRLNGKWEFSGIYNTVLSNPTSSNLVGIEIPTTGGLEVGTTANSSNIVEVSVSTIVAETDPARGLYVTLYGIEDK